MKKIKKLCNEDVVCTWSCMNWEETIAKIFGSNVDIQIPMNIDNIKILLECLNIRQDILHRMKCGEDKINDNRKLYLLFDTALKQIDLDKLKKLQELGEGKYLEGDGILKINNVDGSEVYRVFVTPYHYMGEYKELEDAKNVWYITTGKSRSYEIGIYQYVEGHMCLTENMDEDVNGFSFAPPDPSDRFGKNIVEAVESMVTPNHNPYDCIADHIDVSKIDEKKNKNIIIPE